MNITYLTVLCCGTSMSVLPAGMFRSTAFKLSTKPQHLSRFKQGRNPPNRQTLKSGRLFWPIGVCHVRETGNISFSWPKKVPMKFVTGPHSYNHREDAHNTQTHFRFRISKYDDCTITLPAELEDNKNTNQLRTKEVKNLQYKRSKYKNIGKYKINHLKPP